MMSATAPDARTSAKSTNSRVAEPPGQARDPAEHGEGADAAEARVRTGGVAGPLALDANGGAAKRRDGDSQEVPGVGH